MLFLRSQQKLLNLTVTLYCKRKFSQYTLHTKLQFHDHRPEMEIPFVLIHCHGKSLRFLSRFVKMTLKILQHFYIGAKKRADLEYIEKVLENI